MSSKITKIEITNLKAIEKVAVDFIGCTAIVTGKNDSGKSTLLKGIVDRIRGERPDLIVKNGKESGNASLSLTTGERFDWSFDTNGKDKLTLSTPDGYKVSVTREVGRKFFKELFDIDAFLRALPNDQSKMIQKLAGIDFTSLDSAYKNAYDERTIANRKLKEAEAKAGTYNPEIGEELQDESSLEREIGSVSGHNQLYESAVARNKELLALVDEGERTKIRIEEDAKNEIKRLEGLIKEAKKGLVLDLKVQDEKIATYRASVTKANEWLADPSHQPKDAEALKTKLASIKQANEKRRDNIQAKKSQQVLDDAKAQAAEADTVVQNINAEKAKLIKGAKLPDGISLTDDGVTIDGLPLNDKQVSTSKKYIAGLKLGALNMGTVKTLYFDASHLDKSNLADIQKWAKANDFQLLIERPNVDTDEEGFKYELIECAEGK